MHTISRFTKNFDPFPSVDKLMTSVYLLENVNLKFNNKGK